MAEYIAREALLELINEDCKYKNPTNEYTRGCNEVCDWAIKTIKNIPTADVVPKSEVEMLQGALKAEERHNELTMEMAKKALANAKAEAAREIFAELERVLSRFAYPSLTALGNIKVITAEGWHIRADDYSTIKKKYTEEKE